MIPTEIRTAEIPQIFRDFSQVIGESHWIRRAKRVAEDTRANPHLRDYLARENDVALALARCSELARRYGQIPPEHLSDRSIYPAFQFAAQSLALIEAAPNPIRKAVVRRIHGALRNPDDLRAMQLEAAVATHLLRSGTKVRWPELEQTGTYDLLVEGLNRDGLEVECKICSTDKGRKIHRREALDSVELVRRKLERTARNLHGGLSVVLTIPDRLPKGYKERQRLLESVAAVVLKGDSTTLPDGSEVRIMDFDLGRYPYLAPPFTPEQRRAVDEITRTSNAQAMILGRRNGGARVFALRSRQDDDVLNYVFDTAADAVRRQLSKSRAGLIVVGFEGITPSELVSIGQQDQTAGEPPTALRVAVSGFLRSDERSHLVGAAFLSESSLEADGAGQVSSGGIAYYFPREKGPYWPPAFRRLFLGDARNNRAIASVASEAAP